MYFIDNFIIYGDIQYGDQARKDRQGEIAKRNSQGINE